MFCYDECLIVERIAAAFANQFADIRILEKEFIQPGNLREHLEVSDVPVTHANNDLQRIILTPAAVSGEVAQFAVARITANQVVDIGLEKVLHCETLFFECEIARRHGRNFKKRISGCSGYIILNLRYQ